MINNNSIFSWRYFLMVLIFGLLVAFVGTAVAAGLPAGLESKEVTIIKKVNMYSGPKELGELNPEGEEIDIGFKLTRDAVIITNKRIIDFDSQGATGKKTRVNSIRLNAIIDVTAETAGGGIDDSEVTITHIITPNHKSNTVMTADKKFEFPKKYDISPLYRKFLALAMENVDRINSV